MAMFPQFVRLPSEIRCQIWRWCLPNRLAEVDFLVYSNAFPTKQKCYAGKIPLNSSPPVIASVNKESRDVALSSGHFFGLNENEHGNDIWIQPEYDVLHLHWTRHQFDVLGIRDVDTSYHMFLLGALDLNMPVSISGEGLVTFPRPIDPQAWHVHPDVSTEADGVCGGSEEAYALLEWLPTGSSLPVILDAVSFHISPDQVRQSGLFGLLGDAPVQVVSCDDKKKLRVMMEFFTACSLENKDPAAALELAFILGPDFNTQVERWKEAADWVLLAQMWLEAYIAEELSPFDLGQIWQPPQEIQRGKKTTIFMTDSVLNNAHPWVQAAKRKIPQLRPSIMFRCCFDNCQEGEFK